MDDNEAPVQWDLERMRNACRAAALEHGISPEKLQEVAREKWGRAIVMPPDLDREGKRRFLSGQDES